MMNTQVLTVSPEGKISLPTQMLDQLSIHTGDKLEACSDGNLITLKLVSLTAANEYSTQTDSNRFNEYGLTDDEIFVNEFVKDFRKKKREKHESRD